MRVLLQPILAPRGLRQGAGEIGRLRGANVATHPRPERIETR